MSSAVKRPHIIRVHIVEARGLTGMDDTHMSDGTEYIKIGPTNGIRKETETKYKTVNAVWDRVFMFEDVLLTEEEFSREKITLCMYDRDDFTPNDVIGQFEFSLENVYRQTNHEYYNKWIPLSIPENPTDTFGYLLCHIYVLKEGDPTPAHDEELPPETNETLEDPKPSDVGVRKPYTLGVFVYKAAHLVATESYRGTLNPFVSVRFNGMTQQTKVMSNLASPIWNQKFEMPFHLPLHSDSIEVQVWNRVSMRPDVLIGQQTFSYFNLQLTQRPWGPKWINLYSNNYVPPETTRIGSWVDAMQGAYDTDTKHEYVGRLLVRLSIMPLKRYQNHRLIQMPCNPAAEPAGDEFMLKFLLYSASEVPVVGGKVKVEIAFGTQRVASDWVLAAENGVFRWDKALPNMYLYTPRDMSQVHDVFINVYHMTGMSSRKIAYERIRAQDLLPDLHHYYINGETVAHHEDSHWEPRWRTLQHVYPNPKKAHVIAGFLLCSIGFGLRRKVPPRLPQLVRYNPYPFVLRCRLHQACNLPPGDSSMSTANPFVVIRFAGHTARFPTKQDTLYPFWYEQRELDVLVDKKHSPSVYIMVYHEGALGPVLLGRCEVLASDLLNPDMHGRLFRFPLLGADRKQYTRAQLDNCDKHLNVPYVLASFSLKMAPMLRKGEERKETPWRFEPPSKQFMIKLETVGFRHVVAPLNRATHPVVKIDYPGPDYSDDQVRIFRDLDKMSAGAIGFMETIVLPDVVLPLNNMFGVPLRIRLFDEGQTEVFLGAVHVPVAHFIRGDIEKPPFYVYKSVITSSGDGDGDDDDGKGKDAAAGDADADEDDESDSDEEAELNERIRELDEYERKNMSKEDLMKRAQAIRNQKLGQGRERVTQDVILDLDPKRQNLDMIVPSVVYDGFGARNMRQLKQIQEQKDNEDEILGEVELRKDYSQEIEIFYELELQKYGGAPIAQLQRHGKDPPGDLFDMRARRGALAGVLKMFVRVAPAGEDSMILQDDLLSGMKRLYEQNYSVRVYVYNAVNLLAKDRFLSRQSASPYLVIRNGDDDEHIFADSVNYHENDINPMFYQVIEMDAALPDNSDLTVSVMDHHDYGADDLIGETTIDLEWRLLHKFSRGDMEYRLLKKPGSDLSRGKVLMKVDVLTTEEARRIKAEDLRPPQADRYELRMVLWNTRGVRMPEEKDKHKDVDQKIVVTTNFSGEYNGDVIKETDVAWYSSGGAAEWNHRFVLPISIPCAIPRIKMAIWDEGLISDGLAIGEVQYNLQPFLNKVVREKQSKNHQDQRWIPFTHPDFPGVKLGEANVEFWILRDMEADQDPVGEAQGEPNHNPFLPDPKRNPPPWAVGTRGLDWLASRRRMAICIAIAVLVIPVIAFIFIQAQGAVF